MFIFCAVQDDLDFEFDPVSEPSDQERADLAKCGTDNIVTAYNAGLISQRWRSGFAPCRPRRGGGR